MSWFSNRPLKNSRTAAFVSPGGRFSRRSEDGEALVDQWIERQRVTLLENDVDDAEGLTAQGIGIGRSRRDQADAEESADRVQLVGDADDGPFVGFGKLAARRRGEVMLIDRLGHDGILAGQKGVFAPHDPLEFGEFADHLGVQVGLGEQRRPLDMGRKGGLMSWKVRYAGDPAGKLPETHDLFVGGAEEGMEDDLLEILDAPLQGDLPVRLEEEPRVGEAGADHLLVSPSDDRRIAGQGVVDRQKVGEKLSLLVHHRKIFLVGDHRGDEDLPGKLQVFPIETPADDRRVFGEEGDRLEKLLVPQGLAAHGCGRFVGFLADDPLPFRGIDDDEMAPRLCEVIPRGWRRERMRDS